MNFEEAVSVCFSKYADFDGRGSRAECWGFLGFAALACTAAALVGRMRSLVERIARTRPSHATAAIAWPCAVSSARQRRRWSN